MARKLATADSLTKLFDRSSRPIYAIDVERRVVYCNRALATWLDIDISRIIGRIVEYHSEPAADDDAMRDGAPLTDLCPPPRALAGEPCMGTLSCMARGGRLVHRQAEFVPLGDFGKEPANRNKHQQGASRFAVFVLLSAADMSTPEVAAEISGEPTADEIHRTIRRFRRAQSVRYSLESLLGSSPAMQKVREQVSAAAASGANTLIVGPLGSGRGHVARSIHYRAAADGGMKLVPIDCEVLSDDLLRRAVGSLRAPHGETVQPPTLLLENLDRMSAAHQSLLLAAIRQGVLSARVIATCSTLAPHAVAEIDAAQTEVVNVTGEANGTRSVAATIDPGLLGAISIITIRIPTLAERLEDLPILAQYFLEACNSGTDKQVGSFRADALDLMCLYSWPGELVQLQETIAAAHRACATHEISPGDLPAIIHHASNAAARMRRQPERIVLDELLASIEKEAIVRALAQCGGNKSEAAGLLGMTRPRLYRRLVQLGLAGEPGDDRQQEQPEFIERDLTD